MGELSDKAKAFIAANAQSPVVSGSALSKPSGGASYRLKDGTTFDLSRRDCIAIGHPRWDI